MNTIIALCALLVATTTRAATLMWDANPPGDSVTNYTVYTVAGGVTNKALVGTNTSYNLGIFQDGRTYQFYVTASNETGESGPSDSVSYNAPAPSVTIPASPEITDSQWKRLTNGLWSASLAWKPVTNATSYVVIREQFSTSNATNFTALSTNFVTGTNWSASLNFGLWKISVQSSNSAGLSLRDAYVFSPSIPGKPVGIRIQ